MKQQQLNKLEKFFDQQQQVSRRLSNESQRGEIFPNETSFDKLRSGSPYRGSGMENFQNLVQHCKHNVYSRKGYALTKTKWDTYAPYAFNKLDKQSKTETFLQLFEDYKKLKVKYNEEVDKNKKMLTKIHFLESQFQKIKTFSSLSPQQKLVAEKQKDEEVKKMKQEIKRLHQKIIALTGNQPKLGTRPKSSQQKTQQKTIFPANQNIKAELQNQKKQVRELLLIVDELKKQKLHMESETRNMGKLQSSYQERKVHSKPIKKVNNQSEFYQFTNQLKKWKEKYNDLQLIYNQMVQDKDKQLRMINEQLINIKEEGRMKQKIERRGGHFDISETGRLETRIKELQDENQRLQHELRRMVQLPFYQNNKHSIQIHEKLTKLDLKYSQVKDQLSKANEQSMKYFAELEFKSKQNQMLKSQNTKIKRQFKDNFEKEHSKGVKDFHFIDYDDYYRKLMQLVKLDGEDPVWRKFEAMAKPEFNSMTKEDLLSLSQNLWHSKLQLLGHLEKAQIQLNSLKQNMDQRINLYARDRQAIEEELKVTRARLDEWMSMQKMHTRRDFKVYEQAGIKYDDSISVFEVQELELKELENNQNYFDLYLGHLNIDQTILQKNPKNKIKNLAHFVSFLTIDFYNHETQHSEFMEGITKKLGNNYSFRVQINTYFLKFLSKNTIPLELWSPQGSSTALLGKGQIRLSEIITKSTRDMSNIIRGKCPIYAQGMFEKSPLAYVEYRIRMRLPIGPFLEWAQKKEGFNTDFKSDPFAISHRKMLNVSIERAQGFSEEMNLFVHFEVQEQGFHTGAERGPSPFWDFHRQIPVILDEQFTEGLKRHPFEFEIFDDEQMSNDGHIGVARADLTPLILSTDQLALDLSIKNSQGRKIGKLKVKVGWA